MEKKLPKVFANKIDKEMTNNERVFYDKVKEKEETQNEERSSKNKYELNITQKINKIFNSPKYVYKADVIITTKDEVLSKKIIGRNKNQIITLENELININDIIDIKFSE